VSAHSATASISIPPRPQGDGGRDRVDRKYAWSQTDGPLLVERRGSVPDDQLPSFFDRRPRGGGPTPPQMPPEVAARITVIFLETGTERTLLTSDEGPIAESWALSPDGSRLFAFTLNCAGFSDQYCGADLYRVNVGDGQRAHIARLREAGPLAPSSDGRRVAVSGNKGVFLIEAPR
jgi:hypothetical protein